MHEERVDVPTATAMTTRIDRTIPHDLPIEVGDLLYAVGSGHHAPQSATELLATAQFTIELDDDRPHLGFPKWVYQGHEIGINIHRSRTEALRAYAEHARRRRDQAERERDRAAQEVQWATAAATEATVPAEMTP